MLEKMGYEGVLCELCGLDPSSAIYARVLEMAQSKCIL